VGRNRPAEAMPFDGMVRRYLRIYILLTYSLTNERSRSGSTDYALGVAHNTSHILRLFPRLLRLHIGMCSRRSSNGLILPAYARFHPSFTITHDSCVMSTICQSPRASCGCDDSTIVLPSKMDWRRLFQPTWNEPSIRWNKVSARSHKQKKGNTNTQLSFSPLRKTRGVSPITIPSSTAMNAIKYYQIRCHYCVMGKANKEANHPSWHLSRWSEP